MDWDKYLKRYVWDDDKTPYFISTSKLNRRQAEYEFRAFGILVGFLFVLLTILTLSSQAPMGRSVGASFYSMTMVVGCIGLNYTRNYLVAVYCALAPLAIVIYLSLHGFPPKMAMVDHVVVGSLLLAWGGYSFRLVSIAKRYPYMSDAAEPEVPRRQKPFE